jgi:hypothetical protein
MDAYHPVVNDGASIATRRRIVNDPAEDEAVRSKDRTRAQSIVRIKGSFTTLSPQY